MSAATCGFSIETLRSVFMTPDPLGMRFEELLEEWVRGNNLFSVLEDFKIKSIEFIVVVYRGNQCRWIRIRN